MKIEDCLYKDYLFIDVRTNKEFLEDCIPGSINIPLFDEEERAIIGILYKHEGQEKAIEKGYDIFNKKVEKLISEYNKYRNKKIIILCWRGGMRSLAVVKLLKSLGFDVYQLDGGYKNYRKYVKTKLDNYKLKPKLVVLYGLTGTGKSEILNKFDNSLDLEDLAQHRGSIFGDLGLKPRSQKMFESLLFKRLNELQNNKYIIIEGESRKIGKVMIPDFLFKSMKDGIKIRINDHIENRVKRIRKIYDLSNKENLIRKIRFIEKNMGKKKASEMIRLIEENKVDEFLKRILLEYYDNVYDCSKNKVDYDLTLDKDHVNGIKRFLVK